MAKKFEGNLREYKTKYLRCRGRRNHPWKVKTDFDIVTKTFKGEKRVIEFTQTLHCALCTTDREDKYRVTPTGHFEKIGTSYKYPDGYQLTKRDNRVDLNDARDMLLMREISGELNVELMNRLLSQRPEFRDQPKTLRVVGGTH